MRKLLKKLFAPLAKLFYSTPWLYGAYHYSMAHIAAELFGFPARKLINIGITGTNGKTTTANLVALILKKAGYSVGLATTVNFWIGEKEIINESKLTTQSPEALQKALRHMVDDGNKIAVLEVSSHALKQNRTAEIPFTGAILTNLTRDHLDYHKDFDDYRQSKEKLFSHLRSRFTLPSSMVVNGADDSADSFLQYSAINKLVFGKEHGEYKSVIASDIQLSDTGSRFTLTFPDQTDITINFHLSGKFNIENAEAASALAFAFGVSPSIIQEALNEAKPIPGRMEMVQTTPFKVVIDYAHTPDGYLKALSALREQTTGKLIIVFGAAGDRDKGKRPELGKIASQFGDILIITEEDQGSESAEVIASELLQGIDQTKFNSANHNLYQIFDRPEALAQAIKLAHSDDTVVALGIGAQTVMVKGGQSIPYSERKTLENILTDAKKT